jgi:hypothetical protein
MSANKVDKALQDIVTIATNPVSINSFQEIAEVATEVLELAVAQATLAEAAARTPNLHIDGCRCYFCEARRNYMRLRGPVSVNGQQVQG